ncbi:MAG: hypothetical protein HA492_02480 [Candidatus Verstraetearchaeota archaeon]|jgi:hypothetical protein|nr:hypothetical protein [Candidatus Verstraetearchaeota archaeon]
MAEPEKERDRNIIPPTKYLVALFLIQIALIGGGGALAFSGVGKVFMENLYQYSKIEMGREGSVQYIYSMSEAGYISVDLGVDMKTKYNETHMVVYWYMNIKLKPGSTIIDLVKNYDKAEKVELRVYPVDNPSKWIVIEDYNVSNYPIDVEYGEVGGLRYIVAINGIKADPGSLEQWMIYIWDPNLQYFQYVAAPPDRFPVYNLDSFVFLFDKFGAFPPDCCSGSLKWEYSEYQGPGK